RLFGHGRVSFSDRAAQAPPKRSDTGGAACGEMPTRPFSCFGEGPLQHEASARIPRVGLQVHGSLPQPLDHLASRRSLERLTPKITPSPPASSAAPRKIVKPLLASMSLLRASGSLRWFQPPPAGFEPATCCLPRKSRLAQAAVVKS